MSVEISRLDGGIRVVTHAMEHLETVSLGIWTNAGARDELPHEHGLAHLMEHMAFKGTKSRSALDIAETIEAVGGDINAATAMETTAFYVRVMKDNVDLALDILADIVQNPVFDKAELAREKGVILQEISAVRDTPDELVFDLFQEAAFPDQALGRSVLGTPQSVSGFGAEHLQAFRARHYTKPGLVLCAAGALDHERLTRGARRAFRDLGSTQAPAHAPARFAGGERRADLPLEQVHIVLGFEGVSYTGEEIYTAQMLAGILGGGMSSRLFQEVRERRGLCYSVYAFSWGFADGGLFGIYAGADPKKVPELISVLSREIRGLADNIEPKELERTKAQARSGLLMALESSSARAEQMARQILIFDRVLTFEEMMSRLDAVDEGALCAMARKLFVNVPLALAAVGPLKALASYDDIAAQFQ